MRAPRQQTRRSRGTVCGQTFTASKGTAFYRLDRPARRLGQGVRLLASGCPPAASVAACGRDARTVAGGHPRAGAPRERIPPGLVAPPHRLAHGPADARRIKPHGGVVWIARALAVTRGWWRGAGVPGRREGALAARRVRRVRRGGAPGPLVWSGEGGAPSVRAIRRVVGDPAPTGQRARPPRRRWPCLALAQVITPTTARGRRVGLPRRVVWGAAEPVAAGFGAGVITTAWIERLTATCRARLDAGVRRGRARGRQTATRYGAAYLTGTVDHFCPPPHPVAFQAHRPTTPARAAGLTAHGWSLEALRRCRGPPPRWPPARHRGRRARQERALLARWCA
jgi:hypothetical protein